MALIALAVRIDSPGPVLFRQERVGKDRQSFTILKFRTMTLQAPNVPTDQLDRPELWVTRIGGVLRKFSLDELPQLFNVLMGHMSIVGPRPALGNQYELIRMRDENGAASVRPGITGLAQISGRDEISEEKKAELDGQYVRRLSFAMDCRCFFGSFSAVLTHRGYAEGRRKAEYL